MLPNFNVINVLPLYSKLKNMKNNKKETTFVNLDELRSEYESTYLSYWLQNPMTFEEWLKKEKGIILIKKKIKTN